MRGRPVVRMTAALFFLGVANFFAQTNLQSPVYSDSKLFDYIGYVATLSGETTLAASAPASRLSLARALNTVENEYLSPQELQLKKRIDITLRSGTPLLRTGPAEILLNPELSVSVYGRATKETLLPSDVFEFYNREKPFISLPLEFRFGDSIAINSLFPVQKGFWASRAAGSWTNVPLDASSFDMNAPERASLSAGTDFFTFYLGRGSLSLDRSISGSMALSGKVDALDFASLSFFSPRLRFFINAIELEPRRFAYYHGFSFRPFSFLSFTLAEAATVNSTFDPRYCNPAMVYHSFAGWRDAYGQAYGHSPVGSQFYLSMEAVPLRGFRLYGQFSLNQFQTSYEKSNYEGAEYIPDSWGGLAGVEFVKSAFDGFLLFAAEGYYATPWLYIMSNNAISFQTYRRELVAPGGNTVKPIQTWLGNPLGPDAVSALFLARFDRPFLDRLEVRYRYTVSGSNGDVFFSNRGVNDAYYPQTKEEASARTPSGTVSRQHRVEASYSRSLSRLCEAEALCGFTHRAFPGTADSRSAFGPHVSLSITYRLW